jgi:uncharacterized membrane protein YdjX (TVP38/TMEM64 family)/rhodanese-related sulfurtransferase
VEAIIVTRGTLARFGLFAALAAAIIAIYPYRSMLDVGVLDRTVRNAGAWGPLLYMGLYAIATVLSLPGAVLTLAAGALFGPVLGAFYALTGATIGASAAFAIARYVASDWVARRAGGRTRQLIDGVEKEGWRFVAFVRLVPLFPFNLVNYALGLTRIRILDYALASYVFMLPGAFAYAYLGYAGRAALAGNDGAIRSGLLALSLLAAVAFLSRLVRRWRGAAAPASAELTASELRSLIDRGDEIHVLDVRTVADYDGPGGHVPGAKNIPLEELPQRLDELQPWRGRPVAVICRTNRRSGEAARHLRQSGLWTAFLVSDGMLAWEKAGFPVETSTPRTACCCVPTRIR